jgi:hypothetical protein
MSYVAKTRAILAAAGHRQGSRLWTLADSRLTEGAFAQGWTAAEFADHLLSRA